MKILYALASIEVGGAEILFSDLARGLRARGHEADVLVPAENRHRGAEELADAGWGRVLTIPADCWQNGCCCLADLLAAYDLVNLSLFGPKWRRGLAEAATKARPPGGLPIVHTIHSLAGWTLWYTDNFYPGEPVAAVTTVDRQTVAYISDLWPRGLIVEHVNNGIDVDAFVARNAQPEVRGSPLVITVGRILPWAKHHRMFARVAGLVQSAARADGRPEPIFRVVGGSRPESRWMDDTLQAEAARAGGRIEITGYVSQAEVRRHLAEADLFALTSSSEGAPLAMLEAMAAGLPVVATAVGGVPELLLGEGGERGRLVAVDDDAAMAAYIESYLAEPLRAVRHGQAGRRYVEKHHRIEATVRAYEALYRKVLGRRTGLPGAGRGQGGAAP